MAFELGPDILAIQQEAREVAHQMAPFAAEADECSQVHQPTLDVLRNSNLCSLMVLAAYGGRHERVDPLAVCVVREGDRFSLVLVPADAPGVSIEPSPEIIAPHVLATLSVFRISVAGAAREDPSAHLDRSSLAKLAATEAASRVVDRCVQVMGRWGLIRGSDIERYYRQARPMRIYEGASEVLRLGIANRLCAEVADRQGDQ